MEISDNPKISIVIVNYNGETYLRRTLSAFLSLTYTNKEIIIVDNGSTDGSKEYIKTLEGIKLIESPKLREKNFACNLWVKNASGEYVLMCDNDLLITQNDLLEELLVMYQEKKDPGIIGLSYTDEWQEKSDGYGVFFWKFFIASRKKISFSEWKKLHGSLIWFPHGIWFFIKKDIWDELWGYDEYLAFWWDDNDIGIQSFLQWYKNYIYSNSLQLHIWLQERIDTSKFVFKFKNQVYSELYVIVKNYRIWHMFQTLFLYSLYLFLKSMKQSFERKSILPFVAWGQGYLLFFQNLPVALEKRRHIQRNRKVQKDMFLDVKEK